MMLACLFLVSFISFYDRLFIDYLFMDCHVPSFVVVLSLSYASTLLCLLCVLTWLLSVILTTTVV